MEEIGFETAWIIKGQHNPFFPLTVAAGRTSAIRLGTFGAAALPRSPMVSAQIAWDLAKQCGGRFDLGLQFHSSANDVDQSAGDDFERVARPREYIESLGAIWNTFQKGDRLRYRGRHYQFRLMAPFFNPGPIEKPKVLVALYADQPGLFELAGELCQGLHLPFWHTESYLRDVAWPALSRGLRVAGRERREISIVALVMIASGRTRQELESAKQICKGRIARLAKDHANGIPIDYGSWADIVNSLDSDARAAVQGDDWRRISDDVLGQLAIVAAPEDIASAIRARYDGLVDRVALWWDERDLQLMKQIVSSFRD